MHQQSTVSLENARRMIAGGEAKARDIGQSMNVAIVDNGGNLVAFAHMDGAWKGSVDIEIDKAFISAMFKLATKGLAEKAQPEEPFFGIHVSNHGRVMIFPGGIPLKQDGECVGAVGVSGGDNREDKTWPRPRFWRSDASGQEPISMHRLCHASVAEDVHSVRGCALCTEMN